MDKNNATHVRRQSVVNLINGEGGGRVEDQINLYAETYQKEKAMH